MPFQQRKSARRYRPRLLLLVLGAMLLVSALPLGLYHFQVLRLSQEKLTDTESVQQTELTRSVGQEIHFSTSTFISSSSVSVKSWPLRGF